MLIEKISQITFQKGCGDQWTHFPFIYIEWLERKQGLKMHA